VLRAVTTFCRQADGAALPPHELLAEVRPAERAPADRPFVYANMVTSIDGRAAVGGSSRMLGSPADTLMLTELRTLADAVLIGTRTVRAEGYARLVGHPDRIARRRAAGRPDTPTAVLLSRTLDVPWEAGLFAAADQPVLVYTGTEGDVPAHVAAPVEIVRLRDPTPAAALADLRTRGVRAALCEGGPTLNRALLAGGLVDEVFITVAPLVTADDDAPRIVQGVALPTPATLSLTSTLRHGDELFLRYAVRRDG
jgi:riboflavin-specific deaminase-like protein